MGIVFRQEENPTGCVTAQAVSVLVAEMLIQHCFDRVPFIHIDVSDWSTWMNHIDFHRWVAVDLKHLRAEWLPVWYATKNLINVLLKSFWWCHGST
ncbi:hypothetical protein EGJ58_22070 [Brucella anthropi]|nr:hypothetical protein EGJ58_22070 [Brucella anthropi]